MWEPVSTFKQDDVLIIAMAGKWMSTDETGKLHELVQGELMNGGKAIVLDLEFVQWMNSTGIGALAGVMTSTRSAETKLALANVSKDVQELLDVSQLAPLFTICKTRAEAVKAVS